MNSPPDHNDSLAANPLLLALLLAGFFLALFGTYWDDGWHTVEGRDSFLVPPHVVLYLGITLAGGALSAWALLNMRSRGLRSTLSNPALLLALVGVGTTLASAPIDNGWHLAFGRDSVIWSPPHMLGVVGTLAIAAAMLLELSGSSSAGGRLAAMAAGAGVVVAASTPVLEYETDVPQFDLALYLPVLSLGSSFALALVRRALGEGFSASLTAALHLVALAVVAAVLLALSMPAPLLPALVLPALALDWAARRRLPAVPAAALFAAALFAAYVPYLDLLKDDVFLGLREVSIGLPLAFLGAWASLAAAGWRGGGRLPPPRARVATPLLLALLASLALAPAALAHDPGQGEEIATAALSATSSGSRATMTVDLADSPHCRDTSPLRLVARRAGDEVVADLSLEGRCRFSGSAVLPGRGRWFLYAELDHEGETAETWLPIHSGASERVSETRSVYLPAADESSSLKLVGGGTTYLIVAALLFVVARLYRSSTDRHARPEPHRIH